MTDPAINSDAVKCIKCGFCMAVCPVYQVDRMESHVARGRNVLILLSQQGKLPAGDSYGQSLDFCLMCGQCLSVCPAKVPSPAINIEARKQWVETKGLPFQQRLVYRGILKHRRLMAGLMGLAAMIPGMSQKDGKPLRHLADFMSIFSGGISIPKLSRPSIKRRLSKPLLPPEGHPVKGRIAFFPGCGFEFFFSKAGEDTARCLALAGFEVIYPKGHTCCGMSVHNAGDFETARRMAKRNIQALAGYDHIVTGCATCGSTLKKYGDWFTDDDPIQTDARSVANKVWDFSEFLIKQGGIKEKAGNHAETVTYHSPCHLKFHQGAGDFPRQVLRSLGDINLVEMEGADNCCGLGGTFAMTHRDISLAILKKKMDSIKKTGANTVVTACPGCMIQLMDGVRRQGLDVKVKHISEVIIKSD